MFFSEEMTFADYRTQIEAAIADYFLELAEVWADNKITIVRISQIENRILNLPYIVDVGGTILNGVAENVTLQGDYIPKVGAVESL